MPATVSIPWGREKLQKENHPGEGNIPLGIRERSASRRIGGEGGRDSSFSCVFKKRVDELYRAHEKKNRPTKKEKGLRANL